MKSLFKDFQGGIDETASAGNLTTAYNNVPGIAGALFAGFLSLAGLVLVVYIMYAGYLWATAQGAEDQVKKAKAIIKNCVIGIVLVFASYAIVNIVLGTLADTPAGSGSVSNGTASSVIALA